MDLDVPTTPGPSDMAKQDSGEGGDGLSSQLYIKSSKKEVKKGQKDGRCLQFCEKAKVALKKVKP